MSTVWREAQKFFSPAAKGHAKGSEADGTGTPRRQIALFADSRPRNVGDIRQAAQVAVP